jgi:hypothetical protein
VAQSRRGKGDDEHAGMKASFVDLTKLAGAVSSRTDTIESLAEDVIVLAESTVALTSEVRMVDYRRKVDRRTNFVVYTLLSVVLAILAAGLIVLLRTSHDNHKILQEVESCTDPTGACAKRGQSQTGDAVNHLELTTVFAAECAVQHVKDPTDAIIERCIKDKLSAAGVKIP